MLQLQATDEQFWTLQDANQQAPYKVEEQLTIEENKEAALIDGKCTSIVYEAIKAIPSKKADSGSQHIYFSEAAEIKSKRPPSTLNHILNNPTKNLRSMYAPLYSKNTSVTPSASTNVIKSRPNSSRKQKQSLQMMQSETSKTSSKSALLSQISNKAAYLAQLTSISSTPQNSIKPESKFYTKSRGLSEYSQRSYQINSASMNSLAFLLPSPHKQTQNSKNSSLQLNINQNQPRMSTQNSSKEPTKENSDKQKPQQQQSAQLIKTTSINNYYNNHYNMSEKDKFNLDDYKETLSQQLIQLRQHGKEQQQQQQQITENGLLDIKKEEDEEIKIRLDWKDESSVFKLKNDMITQNWVSNLLSSNTQENKLDEVQSSQETFKSSLMRPLFTRSSHKIQENVKLNQNTSQNKKTINHFIVSNLHDNHQHLTMQLNANQQSFSKRMPSPLSKRLLSFPFQADQHHILNQQTESMPTDNSPQTMPKQKIISNFPEKFKRQRDLLMKDFLDHKLKERQIISQKQMAKESESVLKRNLQGEQLITEQHLATQTLQTQTEDTTKVNKGEQITQNSLIQSRSVQDLKQNDLKSRLENEYKKKFEKELQKRVMYQGKLIQGIKVEYAHNNKLSDFATKVKTDNTKTAHSILSTKTNPVQSHKNLEISPDTQFYQWPVNFPSSPWAVNSDKGLYDLDDVINIESRSKSQHQTIDRKENNQNLFSRGNNEHNPFVKTNCAGVLFFNGTRSSSQGSSRSRSNLKAQKEIRSQKNDDQIPFNSDRENQTSKIAKESVQKKISSVTSTYQSIGSKSKQKPVKHETLSSQIQHQVSLQQQLFYQQIQQKQQLLEQQEQLNLQIQKQEQEKQANLQTKQTLSTLMQRQTPSNMKGRPPSGGNKEVQYMQPIPKKRGQKLQIENNASGLNSWNHSKIEELSESELK